MISIKRIISISFVIMLFFSISSFQVFGVDDNLYNQGVKMYNQTLNGKWKILFDDKNRGAKYFIEQGGISNNNDSKDIDVPSVWNTMNEEYSKYAGSVIYERSFHVENKKYDKAILEFKGSNYITQVWINDKKVGDHEGGYMSFEFDITDFLSKGMENLITIRVLDFNKDGTNFDGKTIHNSLTSKETWYYNYGGIYNDINIKYYIEAKIENVFISTKINGEIKINAKIQNIAAKPIDIAWKIVDNSGTIVLEKDIKNINSNYEYNTKEIILNPKLWTPENPYLYEFRMYITSENSVVDKYIQKIGIKEVLFDNGIFYLNGSQKIIKGVLLQPNYPVGLIAPENKQMYFDELQMVKEAGFNLIRLHLFPGSQEYLNKCDELGIMVYQESAIGWSAYSEKNVPLYKNELKDMAEQSYNHASVMFLGITNENWHQLLEQRKELTDYLSTIDNTKIIVDSGGPTGIVRSGITVNQPSQYGGATLNNGIKNVEDIHTYWETPCTTDTYNFIKNIGNKSLMTEFGSFINNQEVLKPWIDRSEEVANNNGGIFISEYGTGSLMNMQDVLARYNNTYYSDYKEYKSLYDSFINTASQIPAYQNKGYDYFVEESQKIHSQSLIKQVEAMRLNNNLSGFILTQLNDASNEQYAGILDVWRNKKAAYYAAKEINKDIIIVMDGFYPRSYINKSIGSDINIVNDSGNKLGNYSLDITVKDSEGKQIFTNTKTVNVEKGINKSIVTSDENSFIPNSTGKLSIIVTLKNSTNLIVSEKVVETSVFSNQTKVDGVKIYFIGDNCDYSEYGNLADVTDNINEANVVVVGSKTPNKNLAMLQLKDSIRLGKKIIILNQDYAFGNETNIYSNNNLFNQNITLEDSESNFGVALHYLNNTKYTQGIPNNIIMDDSFRDLIPSRSMKLDAEIDAVSGGSLTNLVTAQWKDYKDLAEIKVGNSNVVLCQLKIKKEYGVDPVSDILFRNFISNDVPEIIPDNRLITYSVPLDSSGGFSAKQNAQADYINNQLHLSVSSGYGYYGGKLPTNLNIEKARYVVVDVEDATKPFIVRLWNGMEAKTFGYEPSGKGRYVYDLMSLDSSYFNSLISNPNFNLDFVTENGGNFIINEIKFIDSVQFEVAYTAPLDSSGGWSVSYGEVSFENNRCHLFPHAQWGYYGGLISNVEMNKYHYLVVDVERADGEFFMNIYKDKGYDLKKEVGGKGVYIYDLRQISGLNMVNLNSFYLNFRGQQYEDFYINSIKLVSLK